MPYYIDNYGYAHYHEPAGTEAEWLPMNEQGTLADPSLAQFTPDQIAAGELAPSAITNIDRYEALYDEQGDFEPYVPDAKYTTPIVNDPYSQTWGSMAVPALGVLAPEQPDVLTAGVNIDLGAAAKIAAMLGVAVSWVVENWDSVSHMVGEAFDMVTGFDDVPQLGDNPIDAITGFDDVGGSSMTTGNYPVIPGTDIVLQGPGVPEPYPGYIAKEWAGIGGSRFYLLINGRVVVRKKNGVWKVVRRPKMLHMKASNPRVGDVIKADKIISRATKVFAKRMRKAKR